MKSCFTYIVHSLPLQCVQSSAALHRHIIKSLGQAQQIAIMRVSNLVVAIVSLIVLVTTFTAECGGSNKGVTDGKRTSRSVTAELVAAAATTEADVANNESIARTLQDDENKKQADITNGSSAGGGPSSEHLARILQKEEEDKACAQRNGSSPAKKTNKRTFQLRMKAKGAGDHALMVIIVHPSSKFPDMRPARLKRNVTSHSKNRALTC